MKFGKCLFSIFLVTGFIVNTTASVQPHFELKVGAPFPVLVFPSLQDGTPLSVAGFRGTKLILHIWASW